VVQFPVAYIAFTNRGSLTIRLKSILFIFDIKKKERILYITSVCIREGGRGIEKKMSFLSDAQLKKRKETKQKKQAKIRKMQQDPQYKEMKEIYGWLRTTKEFTLLEKWEWVWNDINSRYIWKKTYELKEAVNRCPKGCPPASYFGARGLCSCYMFHTGDILPKSSTVVSLAKDRPTDDDFLVTSNQ
jgi:hypothetical protein